MFCLRYEIADLMCVLHVYQQKPTGLNLTPLVGMPILSTVMQIHFTVYWETKAQGEEESCPKSQSQNAGEARI